MCDFCDVCGRPVREGSLLACPSGGMCGGPANAMLRASLRTQKRAML